MPKNISKPFLGTTSDVNEAFPGIDEIEVTIEQDPHGFYCQHDWQRITKYIKSNIPKQLSCVNPRCQQGGIDLQNIVLYHENGEYSFSCNGHEGTPGGRRKGDPCDNIYKIKLNVKRK